MSEFCFHCGKAGMGAAFVGEEIWFQKGMVNRPHTLLLPQHNAWQIVGAQQSLAK